MENRKNLHDYGLVLILFGILNLFVFASTVIAGLVDGSIKGALATVEPDILVAVKVVLGIMGAIMVIIIFADVLLGIKALKVSKNPNKDKGYITVAKVFFVLSILSTVFSVVSLINGKADTVDNIISLANAALNVIVYFSFIKHAQAVRTDVINGVE